MEAFCRDCLTPFEAAPGPRCPACRRPRILAHPELGQLTIAHMDCDAFYASVEKRDDPSLADQPLIVGGGKRGVVSTCCYIARIAGVRSAMPMFKALKLCPSAVVVRPRMEVYAAVSRQIREAMNALTPLIEPLSLDEAFLDLSGTQRLLGAPPAVSMARLAQRIERDIGITVSVGLSHCKYLAKVASDLDKPRGFSVIGQAETLAFLAPRPVRTIWGVGAALAKRLEADGIHLIADLRPLGPERLVARYGSIGQRLHELSLGIDARRVDPGQSTKSISAETTFKTDLTDRDQLIGHLWRLAVKTSDRAKAKGIAGATVTLKLKCADFRSLTRQDKPPAPTNLVETIYHHGEAMLAGVLHRAPFRLIGIGISDLTQANDTTAPPAPTPDLFQEKNTTNHRAEAATDEIRARFGKDAIIRGRALR
jgi:DNA polymerase-4